MLLQFYRYVNIYTRRKRRTIRRKQLISILIVDILLLCFSSSGVTKVLLSNLPLQVRLDEVDLLFSNYGHVHNIEKVSSRDPNTQSLLVSYETLEQAQQ